MMPTLCSLEHPPGHRELQFLDRHSVEIKSSGFMKFLLHLECLEVADPYG